MKHFFGRLSLMVTVCLAAALVCGAQSSGSSEPSQSDTSKPAPKSEGQDKEKDSKNDEKNKDSTTAKKKPKKVWTNEEISTVGGTISVVGDSASPNSGNSLSSSKSARGTNADSPQDKQIEQYRDQLRQLQAQLDSIDKKINDLRNFKADNSSPSGGIDPRHGYSMTPVADQIKQLEEKKKQIQGKIDALEDEARKKGIEPGQLR